ncbi:MAG TPA: DNA repair protein RadC [Bacteroidales bacterium]|nr:DNA repair protein RadC [Bacteroidales bacterium]HOK99465.1 DNA repair protein RadC [Bacteroidales bacterium]HPO66336.1 DNA repair protein RadC [Bacteroidales bacterium]
MMNPKKLTIKEWAIDDRPREKMIQKGASALSNAELIAILLGNGTVEDTAVGLGQKLLQMASNNLNELAKFDFQRLCKIKGIGEAKAVRLIAALELGKRRNIERVIERKKITCSNDVADIFVPQLQDLPHEEFWIVLLNRSNLIIDMNRISQGGIAGTVTDVRIILKTALDRMATQLILCHNHPSGNLQPSKEDINFTKKILEAGKLLDIQLLDHIIVANTGYYSFADNGMLG